MSTFNYRVNAEFDFQFYKFCQKFTNLIWGEMLPQKFSFFKCGWEFQIFWGGIPPPLFPPAK